MSSPDGSQPDLVALLEKFTVKAKDSHSLKLMIQIAADLDAKYPNVPQGLRMLADDLEREFHKEAEMTDHTPVPEYESPDDLCECLHARKWHTDKTFANDLNEGCRPTLPRLGRCVCLCTKFRPFRFQVDNGPVTADPVAEAKAESRREVLAEVDALLKQYEDSAPGNEMYCFVFNLRREIAALGHEGAARALPTPESSGRASGSR